MLYILHALAAWVSPYTFHGVFLFEVAAATVYCRFAVKIAQLYAPGRVAWLTAPLVAVVTYTMPAMSEGDSAEEFCLPLLMMGLYYFLRFLRAEERQMPHRILVLNGVLAGIIFWTKYTLLGLFFAWMACVFAELLVQKRVKKAFAACGCFLAGMAVASVPVLVFCALTGTLGALWQVYFYNNLFLYSDMSGSLIGRLIRVEMLLNDTLVANVLLGAFCFVGVFILLFSKQWHWREKLYIACLAGAQALFIWGGGAYWDYYGIPFAVFSVFAPALLLRYVPEGKAGKALAGLAAFSLLWCWMYAPNRPFMQIKQEELVQYQYAQIINQTPNATLLDWGAVDSGFYTAARVEPSCRYFIHTNAEPDEAEQMRRRMVGEKAFDYVVVRDFDDWAGEIPERFEELVQNYEVIETRYQEIEGRERSYTLLRCRA